MKKNKIKVLQIFGEPLSNGGQESFVLNLYNHFNTERFVFDFYTPYYCDNDYLKETVQNLGGTVFEQNLNFAPGGSRNNILKGLLKHLSKNQYAVVHIHSGSISVLALASFAAYKKGIKKIICHSHCAGNTPNFKYKVTKLLFGTMLKKYPTDYLACSKIAGEWKYPASVMKKLLVIKNGVDTRKFCYSEFIRDIFRKKLNLESKFVVGHVGRFSFQKNHAFLIDIFQHILQRQPNATLLLIGEGEEEQVIRTKVKKLGLEDSVIFYGTSNEVYHLMQAMDVFVLPSRFEGLPIVAVEAQAVGLPVVLSDAISTETQITSNLSYMSLEQSAESWASKILEYQSFSRTQTNKEIENAGFDISTTVKMVEKLYLT